MALLSLASARDWAEQMEAAFKPGGFVPPKQIELPGYTRVCTGPQSAARDVEGGSEDTLREGRATPGTC